MWIEILICLGFVILTTGLWYFHARDQAELLRGIRDDE